MFLDIKPLLGEWFASISPRSIGCLFILIVSFAAQKLFGLIESRYFCFCCCAFDIRSRNRHRQDQCRSRFPTSLPRSRVVSGPHATAPHGAARHVPDAAQLALRARRLPLPGVDLCKLSLPGCFGARFFSPGSSTRVFLQLLMKYSKVLFRTNFLFRNSFESYRKVAKAVQSVPTASTADDSWHRRAHRAGSRRPQHSAPPGDPRSGLKASAGPGSPRSLLESRVLPASLSFW